MKKPRRDGAYVRVMCRRADKLAERQRHQKRARLHKNMRRQGKHRLIARQSNRQPREHIRLPEQLSLAHNYNGVVEQINRIRDVGNKRLSINFNHVRHVGAPAALMLAAELEVIKIRDNRRYVANDRRWDPNVRYQLDSMGLFGLLKAKHQTVKTSGEPLDEDFVRFVSGFGELDGQDIMKIINNVEKAFPAGSITAPFLTFLYGGMGEAVTNTRDHAYAENMREDETSRWWISASVNKTNGEIKVICYDRGLTIPGTIFQSLKKIEVIGAFVQGELNDQNIVKAAMLKPKSSTRQPFRGRGLKELVRLINHNGQGWLEIYSRRGMVRYEKNDIFPDGNYTSSALKRELHGTLVIWDIIPSTLEE
ncbi:MAG: hypothetical protein ACR2P4_03010 [Gammaproteobacteria bacterium]